MATISSNSVGLEDMQIYEHRLASFDKVHTRRRASNINARVQQPPLKWPHSSPSVEKLAKAGFYYRPTANSIDNSSCFLCKKSLDGWEPDDIPAIEHAKHSSNCGWAILHVTADKLRSNHNAVIDDPRSIAMYEARKMTFGNRWPHEKKKGWLPKMAKLAEAGFHYDPRVDSDDFVQCAYCELGLDGWNPEDDPLEEHNRRQSDCKFFTWSKNQATFVSSLTPSSRQVPPSFDSCVDALSDSGLSGAESIVSRSKGLKKVSARGRRIISSTTTRQKMAQSKDPDSEIESTPGSPPPAQPIGRVPRGKKRTSSALGANRISLFDANDFADGSFVKPPITAKPLRQSKRPRASAVSNTIVNEDQQIHYDSDASNAATAGASKRKRGGASRSARGTKPLSRYQIPDDEEIDRALELDLERELTEEEYSTRYTKPFIKTPKRRLTRSKMVFQMQTEEPPPKLGSLPPEPSIAPKSSKKFTPTGMRNYFANHNLDYTLPISIPRHLVVAGENGEIDARVDDDTPVKVKNNPAHGRGVADNEGIGLGPDPAPEAMEEDEVIILSEKIVKKGGGKKGRKAAGMEAIENTKTKRTTAAAVVTAVKDAEAATRPVKYDTNTKRRTPAPPVEENLAPVPRLTDIRKSIDGGVVLFDGGASSSDEAQEKTQHQPESKSELVQGNILASSTTVETSGVPPRKGRRNLVGNNSRTKGRRGKTVLRAPEHSPQPEPEQAPDVKVNPATVLEQEVMKGKSPYPSDPKKRYSEEATLELQSTVPLATETVQVQITSPISNPSIPNGHPDTPEELSGEITSMSIDKFSSTKMPTPSPHSAAKLTINQGVSVASILSANGSGNTPGSTKPTTRFDGALAKSFGPPPTENHQQNETEPGTQSSREELYPALQELAKEPETVGGMQLSPDIYKGKEKRMKSLKTGGTRRAEITKAAGGQNLEEVTIVVDERVTGKKMQTKQEKLQNSTLESQFFRRSSARTRGSIHSQPNYGEPETSEEEKVERDTGSPEPAGNGELNGDGGRSLPHRQVEEDESDSEYELTIPKKKNFRSSRSRTKRVTPAAKVQPDAGNHSTLDHRSFNQVTGVDERTLCTAKVRVSPRPNVVRLSGRSRGRVKGDFPQTVSDGRETYYGTSTDDEGQVEIGQGADKVTLYETTPRDENKKEVEERGLELEQVHKYKTEVGETDSAAPVSLPKCPTITSVEFGQQLTTCLPLSPVKSKVSSHLQLPPPLQNKPTISPPFIQTSPILPSCAQWNPVDLDALAPVGGVDIDDGGEDGGNEGAVNNEELLTQEERGMTVQEWVRRNAERAEGKFRERCEGVIGRLVEESKRAVRAIEGIKGG